MSPQNDLTKQEFLHTLNVENKHIATLEAKNTALADIKKFAFPSKNEEAWRKTDIRPILRHRYKKGQPVKVSQHTVEMYRITDFDTDTLVFINGHFSTEHSTVQPNQKGFFAGSAKVAKNKFPDTFKTHFSKAGFEDDNLFSAINTAFAEDGFCILLPQNFIAEKPIRILNFTDGDDQKIINQTRNLIIAGKNSQANIICSYHSLSTNYTLNNVTTEIFVEQNANLNFSVFQGEGDDAFHISNTQITQQKNSVYTENRTTLCGAIVRNAISVKLAGEYAETTLNGLYMPDREQHFDNHIFIKHEAPHCKSTQLYKGILDNKAKAIFTGKVFVGKKAEKTDAVQANKNLLLSNYAKAFSRPQLEIYTDDVSCAHGSTTGQLDKEAIYYIRTRGIGEKQAQVLMTYAFASEVINKIKSQPYKEYIDYLVDMRLKGEKVTGICSQQYCHGC